MEAAGKWSAAFEETCVRLRELLLRDWKALARALRDRDPTRAGTVDYAGFRAALAEQRALLSDEEFFQLAQFYDPHLTGRVPYYAFIKAFLESTPSPALPAAPAPAPAQTFS